jgi:hypothetical protein
MMKNRPLPDAPVSEAADSREALLFVQRLQVEFARERPLNREAFVEQYLDQFPLGTLRSIGRRILMDIMKRPQPSTDAEPERPAPRRTRARQGGSGRRSPAGRP